MLPLTDALTLFLCYRDAWKGVEKTTKEEAWEKYVARLIEVSSF